MNMRMIPDTPYCTHSKAERRVFDRLRSITFDDDRGQYTAFHSLNLTKHEYKRFGEIDFLITGPAGIFAIEVKGGRISCVNGEWEYMDRYNNVRKSVEGPFRQAESALHGLMNTLRSNLPPHVLRPFHIGFGVVTPDQQWCVPGAEWDPHTLADARKFMNFDKWLMDLFQYWKERDGTWREFDSQALRRLNQFIRPNLETALPLYAQAFEVEERVNRLTADQMAMVDVVHANQRVICHGGAGTGKTFMAKELARRWTATGMNVLLACQSPFLKHHIEANFPMPRLKVSLIKGVETARRRMGIERFDALIVDEGQDMFNMKDMEILDAVLKGGLEHGRWCFFHDMNNQSRLFDGFEEDAVVFLNRLKDAVVPLRTNCRNTKVILDRVKADLGADMGVRGAGSGPPVREYRAARKECPNILLSELTELTDRGGLSPGDITILSPLQFARSCVSKLPEHVREKIITIDEYSTGFLPVSQISFSRIQDFKGLESEAVIVVDLCPPHDGPGEHAMHYVAMSRPRAVLSLIYMV